MTVVVRVVNLKAPSKAWGVLSSTRGSLNGRQLLALMLFGIAAVKYGYWVIERNKVAETELRTYLAHYHSLKKTKSTNRIMVPPSIPKLAKSNPNKPIKSLKSVKSGKSVPKSPSLKKILPKTVVKAAEEVFLKVTGWS